MQRRPRPWPLPFVMALLLAFVLPLPAGADEESGPPRGPDGKLPWERFKDDAQDNIGGVRKEVLDKQSTVKVKRLPKDEAIVRALDAARKIAAPLIDTAFHTGKRLLVPSEFKTIQAALDAATERDVVVVTAGTYYELLVMKAGVKLVSDASEEGDEPVVVRGAKLKLPRRALRTIIDGSKSKPSHHGMVDFLPGTGRHTVVDGFTFQNLPKQNHHIPGHAHGINLRGASPVLMNCLLQNLGSTAIGSHVVYKDQKTPMAKRDFRYANIQHPASAVIFGNVVRGSVGLGIGCNHFSTPYVLGNEVYGNDDSEMGEAPGPGIGAKHGAAPIIVGNLVYGNAGGGILNKVGAPQGAFPIDRVTHPTVEKNVVYENGTLRAGISSGGGGSRDKPVRILSNWVYDAATAGIGLSDGATAVILDNHVEGGKLAGIAINGATVLQLNRNQVTGAGGAGFVFVAKARILEMEGNASDGNKGPRFMQRGATIAPPK